MKKHFLIGLLLAGGFVSVQATGVAELHKELEREEHTNLKSANAKEDEHKDNAMSFLNEIEKATRENAKLRTLKAVREAKQEELRHNSETKRQAKEHKNTVIRFSHLIEQKNEDKQEILQRCIDDFRLELDRNAKNVEQILQHMEDAIGANLKKKSHGQEDYSKRRKKR